MGARGLPRGIQSRGKEISAPCPVQTVRGAGGSTPFQWEAVRGGYKPGTGPQLNPKWPMNPRGLLAPCLGRGCTDFITNCRWAGRGAGAAVADVHSLRAWQPRGEVRDGCSRGEPHAGAGTWAGRVTGTVTGRGISSPGAEGSRYGSQSSPCVVSPASEHEFRVPGPFSIRPWALKERERKQRAHGSRAGWASDLEAPRQGLEASPTFLFCPARIQH